MSKLLKQAEAHLMMNNLCAAAGVPMDNVVDAEDIGTEGANPAWGERGAKVLFRFRLPCYTQSFVLLSFDLPTGGCDLLIALDDEDMQVYPGDYSQAFFNPKRTWDRSASMTGIVFPFALKMRDHMTQEKLDAWIAGNHEIRRSANKNTPMKDKEDDSSVEGTE